MIIVSIVMIMTLMMMIFITLMDMIVMIKKIISDLPVAIACLGWPNICPPGRESRSMQRDQFQEMAILVLYSRHMGQIGNVACILSHIIILQDGQFISAVTLNPVDHSSHSHLRRLGEAWLNKGPSGPSTSELCHY